MKLAWLALLQWVSQKTTRQTAQVTYSHGKSMAKPTMLLLRLVVGLCELAGWRSRGFRGRRESSCRGTGRRALAEFQSANELVSKFIIRFVAERTDLRASRLVSEQIRDLLRSEISLTPTTSGESRLACLPFWSVGSRATPDSGFRKPEKSRDSLT